jgi:RNA polymerase sigma factor (sigma-70 family)
VFTPEAKQPSPSTPGQTTHEAVFGRVFNRIQPDLLGAVTRLTKNKAVAEDIVQKTAIRILGRLRRKTDKQGRRLKKLRLDDDIAFFRYCRRTAYRLTLTHFARVKAEGLLTESDLDAKRGKENSLDRIPHPRQGHPEDRVFLHQVLGDLSHEERTVFWMRLIGYSADEVGESLGYTANNIAQIRYRATARLCAKYGGYRASRQPLDR